MATRIARLGQAARRAISRAIKSLASASLGGETISYVTLGAEVLKSLLIGAGEKQASPANPVPQPLRYYGVVLNMSSELPGSKRLPVVVRSATFPSELHSADFDVPVLNSVFFDPRAVGSFEAKVHRHQSHGSKYPASRPEILGFAGAGSRRNPVSYREGRVGNCRGPDSGPLSAFTECS